MTDPTELIDSSRFLDGYESIPIGTFLVGWTSIYQLFWCELQGYQGFDPSPDQRWSKWFKLNSKGLLLPSLRSWAAISASVNSPKCLAQNNNKRWILANHGWIATVELPGLYTWNSKHPCIPCIPDITWCRVGLQQYSRWPSGRYTMAIHGRELL